MIQSKHWNVIINAGYPDQWRSWELFLVVRFCQNIFIFRQKYPATCDYLRPPHGVGRRGKVCNFILLLCRKWLFQTLISHKLLFNISVKLHKMCRIDPNERLYFSIFSTLNGYGGWTMWGVNQSLLGNFVHSTWKSYCFTRNPLERIASKLSTMVGENLVWYLSQMARIALNCPT